MRCFFMLAVLLAVGSVHAEDWPQWLGPRRDASSTEKVEAWKNEPKVLWRVKVGEGHSSPVVADGKVFLHTKVKGKDSEEVTAYAVKDGKPVWSKQYDRGPLHDKFITQFGVGPRATPALYNDRLFTFGVTGHFTCWDASNGKEVWTVDTAKKFTPAPLAFGTSCSPLLEGDKVLLNIGGKGASIVAFERDTGKTAWKVLDDPPSYSSPVAHGSGKGRQLVFLTAEGLVGLTPDKGQQLWRVPLKDKWSESSTTPVLVGSWLFGSSVTFGSLGVRMAGEPAKPADQDKETRWKNEKLTCYFATPVPVGKEYLYVVTGQPPPLASASLHCVEVATGKVLWTKNKVGTYHASLLRTADDKLLMLDDFGNLKLVDPDPKGYRELASAAVCRTTWAHPALSDGRLYLRDEVELMCVQVGKAAE